VNEIYKLTNKNEYNGKIRRKPYHVFRHSIRKGKNEKERRKK